MILNPRLWLILVTLLAAVGWLLTKYAVSEMGPYEFISLRFLIASILLAVIGYKDLMNLTKGAISRSLYTGLLLGVQMVLWVSALESSANIGLGSFIGGLAFVLISVVGYFFFKSPISMSNWISVFVAALGLGVLNLSPNSHLSSTDALFFVSAIVYAFYFNVSAKYADKIAPLPLTSLQMMSAAICNLVAAAIFGDFDYSGVHRIWVYLLGAAILASALRYYAQSVAQSFGNFSSNAIILTLEPIWVSILSIVMLGEYFSISKILGCGLIFISIIINGVALNNKRKKVLGSIMGVD